MISLTYRFLSHLSNLAIVLALCLCVGAASAQELAPPTIGANSQPAPRIPIDEGTDEALSPFTILPPPQGAAPATVGDPLHPIEVEMNAAEAPRRPGDYQLPRSFVPGSIESPLEPTDGRREGFRQETSDSMSGDANRERVASDGAPLDTVFPSLAKPSEATLGDRHENNSSPPGPNQPGMSHVAQSPQTGIRFPEPPADRGEPPPAAVGQYQGWWQSYVGDSMRNNAMPRPVTINGLIAAALQHSSQIKVLSDSPLIRDTAIIEADAAFDWSTFVETTWNETNEPVGSVLTTGGPPRFLDKRFDFDSGFRRQTGVGGQFEVGQRYGYEDSNSVFFIPNSQGTARLTLSYTQPLLRGAGRAYNTSLIVLAQVDSAIARDDFSRQLQEHLLEITNAYWVLYLERASLLQRQRLYDRGRDILTELEYREMIDAVTNQIVRARAAVASRKSDLFRSAAAVKNAEGRIRALVNAPQLGLLDEFELMPKDLPTTQYIPIDLRESLELAIRRRPEINVAMKQIRASAVRRRMSKNELLPALDMVLETYVAGLRGNSSIGDAFTQQFSEGAPSYTAGLQFEVPLRNRAARARFQRRQLELRQFEHQFKNTLHALQLEVEIAVREVHTSFREIESRFQSMNAAGTEVDYIGQRWQLLPGEDRSASLILEDLLDAQERLTVQEFAFANAQVTYNLALTNVKRAMGTLLQFEQVAMAKSEENGIPSIRLQKTDMPGNILADPTLKFGPE
jgi:outer membrane protein